MRHILAIILFVSLTLAMYMLIEISDSWRVGFLLIALASAILLFFAVSKLLEQENFIDDTAGIFRFTDFVFSLAPGIVIIVWFGLYLGST